MTETITTLRVEDVYPNPRHYREVRAESVKQLAANIAVAGQLEPIRVWQDGEIYYVDAGHHRLEAIKSLGLETIDAIVQDADSLTAMVASNMHVPESLLEKSRGAQLLLETGIRPVEAAALVGEDQDKLSRAQRALSIVTDPVVREDLTLDRLAAIDEFSDDAEAVEKLTNARESDWARLAEGYRRDRAHAEAITAAEAIIKAAGCEVLDPSRFQFDGYQFIERGSEAPEGATAGKVAAYYGGADISWFKAVSPGEVSEAEAERARAREAEAELLAQWRAIEEARRAFVVSHVSGEAAGVSLALHDLAKALFDEHGLDASPRQLEGVEIPSFMGRIYGALLLRLDGDVRNCLQYSSEWTIKRVGGLIVEYYAALVECGYEVADLETPALESLREALSAGTSEDEDADPCATCEEDDDAVCAECVYGDGDAA